MSKSIKNIIKENEEFDEKYSESHGVGRSTDDNDERKTIVKRET
jgi:hypothetical protein